MQHPIELILENTAATPEIEASVFEAVGRLERFCDHITACQVFIKGPATGNGYAVRLKVCTPECEVLVTGRGRNDSASGTLRHVLQDAFARAECELSELGEPHCICSGAHESVATGDERSALS